MYPRTRRLEDLVSTYSVQYSNPRGTWVSNTQSTAILRKPLRAEWKD